jgi:hypothetical protein
MPVSFSCPCGKKLRVGDELVGRRVKCPGCARVLSVPAPAAAKPAPAPAVVKPEPVPAPAAVKPKPAPVQPEPIPEPEPQEPLEEEEAPKKRRKRDEEEEAHSEKKAKKATPAEAPLPLLPIVLCGVLLVLMLLGGIVGIVWHVNDSARQAKELADKKKMEFRERLLGKWVAKDKFAELDVKVTFEFNRDSKMRIFFGTLPVDGTYRWLDDDTIEIVVKGPGGKDDPARFKISLTDTELVLTDKANKSVRFARDESTK